MTNEEALRQLGVGAGHLMTYEAIEVARKALEEKVEREKAGKKRWRPDLKTLAEFIRVPEPIGGFTRQLTSKEIMHNHAADIIEALDKEVMPELRRYIGYGPTGPLTIALRKALGDYQ